MPSAYRAINATYQFIVNPGYRGKQIHKVSHFLWCRNLKRLANISTAFNLFVSSTGIEPGAKIDDTAEIIHGSVFIGNTAEIGPYCKILQNVSIAAKMNGRSTKLDSHGERIHPILEAHVTVCAGAVIVGRITIGHHSVIGPNSVVTRSIPPYSMAVGVPAKIYKRNE
jgi:serine O-acetyltransferase